MSNPKTITVQLLDGGKFKITVDDKIILGKFGMKALESFLKLRNIPGIFVLTDKQRAGMMPTEYADFILCAIQSLYADPADCEYKQDDVLEWFELMGGFGTDHFLKLIAQGMKMYADVTSMIGKLDISEEEKKILLGATASNGSDSNATGRGSKRKNTRN